MRAAPAMTSTHRGAVPSADIMRHSEMILIVPGKTEEANSADD